MKKVVWGFVLILFYFSSVIAKEVPRSDAMEAARAFLAQQSYTGLISMEMIDELKLESGETVCYLIALNPRGWILVSADDLAQPILAFSFHQDFDALHGWQEGATFLVNNYKEQIGKLIREGKGDVHPEWRMLSGEVMAKAAKATSEDSIGPIISVAWNQSSGWNRFCPSDENGPGGHVYVGCVAVSMAQAMSVYNYPSNGKGIASYVHEEYGSQSVNFDIQEPYSWNLMGSTSSDDYNAKLLFDCAVTVEMDFGHDGSGAFVRNAASAMVKYFSYSQSLRMVDRYEDDDEWIVLLKEELKAGRPLIYRGEPGDGTAGHAWNVDGYSHGYFHMNFGWSGSNNGYYSLNAINPGSNDFNSNQGVVIGIRPPKSAPYDIDLSNTQIVEGLEIGSYVANIMISDEDSENSYEYTCFGDWDPLFERWGDADFFTRNDSLFTAVEIKFNPNSPEMNRRFLRLKVQDTDGDNYSEDFYIDILDSGSGTVNTRSYTTGDDMIYPNPVETDLYIRAEGEQFVEFLELSSGRRVVAKLISDGHIDVSFLPEGLYILKVHCAEGTLTSKVLISR